ncbi:hypothetical protein O3P69_006834 [Scylla paramamosain]|uniref:Uncharacterized protein n=1 Tax=Scylla paramamosain TaxID=85552 RepID=A0AAW0U307_SCYPA
MCGGRDAICFPFVTLENRTKETQQTSCEVLAALQRSGNTTFYVQVCEGDTLRLLVGPHGRWDLGGGTASPPFATPPSLYSSVKP